MMLGRQLSGLYIGFGHICIKRFAFWNAVSGASFWKMHHMNERRKTEEFYAKLEAGEITVSADE